MGRLRFAFSSLLFALLQARVVTCRELALKLLDTSSRIDELQFARKERVAHVADIDPHFLCSAASNELVATTAMDVGVLIVRVDVFLHFRIPLPQ